MRISGNDVGPPQHMGHARQRLFSLFLSVYFFRHFFCGHPQAMSVARALVWVWILTIATVPVHSNSIAILLTGQFDAFNRTICALKQHLVAPLQRNGSSIHIFALTSKEDDQYGHIQLVNKMPDVVAHTRTLDDIDIPSQCMEYAAANFLTASKFAVGKKGHIRFMESIYFKGEVDSWFRTVAAESGIHFDWVIWLPVQVLLMEPLADFAKLGHPGIHIPEWSTNVHAINDLMVVADPQGANKYFSLYNALCVENVNFPPKYEGERIYKWYSGQRDFQFAKSIRFRFVVIRPTESLPMKQETPAYFNPEVLLCKNYRYMRIAWRVRSLQLECRDASQLALGPDTVYPIPTCVWPSRKSMRGRNSTQVLPKLLARNDGKSAFQHTGG